MHDHPILGPKLAHRWGDPLEYRIGVAQVTGQQPDPDAGAHRVGPQRQGGGPQRHSSSRVAKLLIYPSGAEDVALLLGIGHPRRTLEWFAAAALTLAVDGASDHANLGYVQVAAFGHAVAALFGADPKREMDEDLLRMKTIIETGRSAHDAARPVSRES